jgi:hypothetical protein
MKSRITTAFANPFRPGAGHPPPYLAGRESEKEQFLRLLDQQPILANLVLTGLRGVGKTVLLESFKPLAIQRGWLWASTDLSESASVSEEGIATRMLTDLAPLVANVVIAERPIAGMGFRPPIEIAQTRLDFTVLTAIYEHAPGLVSDKLKQVLHFVWDALGEFEHRGIVLAYDEAQNLSDQSARHQYPLSLLLDVFQSIQKQGIPILLVLAGLPTLFPNLVEARTFAERMFQMMTLGRLSEAECRDAILKPMDRPKSAVHFDDSAVAEIVRHSGGYPYFIQFICRELYDTCLQQRAAGQPSVMSVAPIVRKLDSNFFAGRWYRVTDRQRELLGVIAELPNCDGEFTVQETVAMSKAKLAKPFSASHVTQLLGKLADIGMVYKSRHGYYSFAVPLLGEFIKRQRDEAA